MKNERPLHTIQPRSETVDNESDTLRHRDDALTLVLVKHSMLYTAHIFAGQMQRRRTQVADNRRSIVTLAPGVEARHCPLAQGDAPESTTMLADMMPEPTGDNTTGQ